jgi:hypothetical protein
MGGYFNLSKVDSASLFFPEKNLGKESTIDSTYVSETNLQYLRKTIDLCKSRGKEVMLIRSPLHYRYQGYCNEQAYQRVLRSQFADVRYIDLSKFPLNNSDFGDLEHLSYHGALTFSNWFRTFLKDGLKSPVPDQKIIPSYL